MFGRIDFLKKSRAVHSSQENPALECILIEMQASNFSSEVLIKEETPALVLSSEFCKNFKNTFFTEQFCVSVILRLQRKLFFFKFRTRRIITYIITCSVYCPSTTSSRVSAIFQTNICDHRSKIRNK